MVFATNSSNLDLSANITPAPVFTVWYDDMVDMYGASSEICIYFEKTEVAEIFSHWEVTYNGTTATIPYKNESWASGWESNIVSLPNGATALQYAYMERCLLDIWSDPAITGVVKVVAVFAAGGDEEFSVSSVSSNDLHGIVSVPVYLDALDVYTMSAAPILGYMVDYWAHRPAESAGEYTKEPGSDSKTVITVTISEDTEYICYFKPTEIVLEDYHCFSDAEHLVRPGQPTYRINVPVARPIDSIDEGRENSAFALNWSLLGTLENLTPVKIELFAGDGVDGTPFYLADAVFGMEGLLIGDYIEAAFYNQTLLLFIDIMPLTDKITVRVTLGGVEGLREPVIKTYDVNVIPEQTDNQITAIFAIQGVTEPVLVHVPEGINHSNALLRALTKEYPVGDPRGTGYVEVMPSQFGLWVNYMGVDPTGQLSGRIVTDKQMGRSTYMVNGFYANLGVSGWIVSDGEVFVWGTAQKDDNPDHRIATRLISGDYNVNRAIAILRYANDLDDTLTNVADADLSANNAPELTVAQLAALYPDYAHLFEGIGALPSAFTENAQVIAAKTAIDALDEDSTEQEIQAARTLYNAISVEIYKYYFRSNEPYKETYDKLIALELVKYGNVNVVPYTTALDGTLNVMSGTIPTFGTVNGEWAAFALARGGKITPLYKLAYLGAINAALSTNENGTTSKTDLARIVIALTALGEDASAYNTRNLVAEMDAAVFGTINGDIYALLALNSKPYDSDKRGAITVTYNGETYDEIEVITGYIKSILDAQLDSGGWSLSPPDEWNPNPEADIDITAMAIQALAPYYQTSATVNAAVENALDWLKTRQSNNGGFAGFGGSPENSTESDAQIVVALTALGIDPTTWEKPGGRNPLTAMLENYNASSIGGWFGKSGSSLKDDMSTEQAAYALVAYDRFLSLSNTLYNMSDAFGGEPVIEPGDPVEAVVSIQLDDSGFAMAKQEFSVETDLSERYGYADAYNGTQATALDALVAAHIAMFGDEDLGSYLEVTGGTMKKIAGESALSSYFFINGALPGDETVSTAVLSADDDLLFYLMQDPDYFTDALVWFVDADGDPIDAVTVEADEEFDITLVGYMAIWGMFDVDVDDWTDVIEDAQIVVLEIGNDVGFRYAAFGEELGLTDENGQLTVSFGTPGEYILSAYDDSGYDMPFTAPWLAVTVTEKDTAQDDADILAAKTSVTGAVYTAAQATTTNAANAKSAVEAIISGLDLNGVTASVTGGAFTEAAAGTPGNTSGTNGSYTFTVALNKGAGVQQLTDTLTLTISATPYIPAGNITVTVTVEKFRVPSERNGGGYFIEPTLITVPTGSGAAQVITQMLGEGNYVHTGAVASNFYLSGIRDASYTEPDDSIKKDGYLGEFDESAGSGWMFSVNNSFPTVSASAIILNDGDVIRWQYTLDTAGNSLKPPNQPANKDALTKKIAEIRALDETVLYGDAYTDALTVLKTMLSAQDEVNTALAVLNAGPPQTITLQSITISQSPAQVSYDIGDTLDLTGLIVTALYSDSSSEAVTSYTTDPADGDTLDAVGTIRVTVTYQGETAAFDVFVNDTEAPVTLTGISITNAPDKLTYTTGETLDLSGLVVTAVYSDGGTEILTNYTTDPLDGAELDTAGTQPVTISYTEDDETKTASFNVTVTEPPVIVLTGIAISDYPEKRTYTVGDTLDLSGLTVTATYSDSSSSAVTGYSTSPSNGATLSTAGTQTVTISYIEDGVTRTTSFTITVNNVVQPPEPTTYQAALTGALGYLRTTVNAPNFGSVGGEWLILSLARGGYTNTDFYDAYYSRILEEIAGKPAKLDTAKSTENSRLILALTALGIDAASVGGKDLVAPLSDMDWLKRQGINGPIFALIALDSKPYAVSGALRQDLVDYIISQEVGGGGWALSGTARAEVDMTAMALQALASYKSQPAVSAAISRAVSWLKSQTINDAEGWAQIIVALSALEIDAQLYVDALLTYRDAASGGFIRSGMVDLMSSEQAAYALIAYDRYKTSGNALYDMSDAVKLVSDSVAPTVADKTELNAKIAEAEALNSGSYTSASWSALTSALNSAKTVRDNANVTQSAVDAAVSSLTTAISNLRTSNSGSTTQPEYVWISVSSGASGKSVSYSSTKMELNKGETAFSLLQRTGMTLNYSGNTQYSGVYVSSINGLAEFDVGPQSGWMYSVNGVFPNYSSSLYKLNENDVVLWIYTLDLGNDVGGGNATGNNSTNAGNTPGNTTGGVSSGGATGTSAPTVTDTTTGSVVDDGETPLTSFLWTDSFTDVGESDWFYEAVKYACENGLMNGIGDETFAPNSNLTRAMLVTILYRYEGEPDVNDGTVFADVPENEWYTDAIAWASANGIVNGYGDGLFGTNDDITREQLATILYNFAKFKRLDVSKTIDLETFEDGVEVSTWAADAMAWAVAEGLINGRSATELAANGTATRAEAATLLMRFIEAFLK